MKVFEKVKVRAGGRWLAVVVLTIVFLSIADVGASAQRLNFGLFSAQEELTKTLVVQLDLDAEAGAIKTWVEEDLIDREHNRSLPANRLQMSTGGSTYTLGGSPLGVPVSQTWISIAFSYTVLPRDLPGIYETTVIISEEADEGRELQRHRLTVRVEVAPWLVIRTNTELINMKHALGEPVQVTNGTPGIIEVAGNVPWELYGLLAEGFPYQSRVALKLMTAANTSLQTLISPQLDLQSKPVLLATGPPTAGESSLWFGIYFQLIISDFTKVTGGKVNFPVTFFVAPQ